MLENYLGNGDAPAKCQNVITAKTNNLLPKQLEITRSLLRQLCELNERGLMAVIKGGLPNS